LSDEEFSMMEIINILFDMAEDHRYLDDYPILIVEESIKPFIIMDRREFEKRIKELTGE